MQETSKAENALRAMRRSLLEEGKNLPYEAVLNVLQKYVSVFDGLYIFAHQPRLFGNADKNISSNLTFLVFLSAKFSDRECHRYTKYEDCVSDFCMFEEKSFERSANFTLSHDGKGSLVGIELTTILLEVLQSIYDMQISNEQHKFGAKKFRSELISKYGNFVILDILNHINALYDVEGLTYVQYGRDETQPQKISIIEQRDIGITMPRNIENLFESVKYAAKNNLPNSRSAQLSGGKQINYVTIPVSNQNWKSLSGDVSGGSIILFAINGFVDRFLIEFIHSAAERAAENVVRSQQLLVLTELDRIRRRMLRHVRQGELAIEREREDFVYNAIGNVLKKIYNCTNCHSVTVRKFDPFSNKMNIVAQCAYEGAEYKEGFCSSIDIHDESSVNAQCFTSKGPEGYVYIPDLGTYDAPDAQKFNPRGSKSELCFVIWKSGIPFGTINSEAGFLDAFKNDIAFFGSVSRQLGDLFTALYDTSPPSAIAQISRVNDLAHGSLATLEPETKSFTSIEPDTLRTVIENWSDFERDFRSVFLIDVNKKYDLHKSTKFLMREQLGAKFASIDLNQTLFVPNPITLSAHEWENLSSILKAVMSNAVNHSDICRDFFRIVGIQRNARTFIFMKYRSVHRKIAPDKASKFGLEPVVDNGSVRYGAYLLGTRVRAAGGLLSVRRPLTNDAHLLPLELSIALPMGAL